MFSNPLHKKETDMIDVILFKKNFSNSWFNTQEELHANTVENFNKMLPELPTFLEVKRNKSASFFKCFTKTVESGKGDIIIAADVGTLFIKPFQDTLNEFTTDSSLGILGCKLLDVDFELIDAGVELPLKPQPIWRRFKESPNVAELAHKDYNTYIDAKLIVIRRDMLKEVPIDPEAGLYWAINLCWEASRKNWSVLYTPEELLYTNYAEKNKDILDDMYGEAQQWFANKTKQAAVKK